jgi:hypothetical protein
MVLLMAIVGVFGELHLQVETPIVPSTVSTLAASGSGGFVAVQTFI